VKAEVRKRGEIFEAKGWTRDELTNWYAEVDAAFAGAFAKVESTQLNGHQAAGFDLNSDQSWGQALGIIDPFLRSAVWAHWKQAIKRYQDAGRK
jgi:hypothetical protein